MECFNLPPRIAALVFDLDSTLYSHEDYAAFQNRVLVERLAERRGEGVGEVEGLLAGIRAERRAAGLPATSLANLFLALGIPIEESVRWREELIRPEAWLGPDPALAAGLADLASRFRLALVTNNPRSVGEGSLGALGVRASFEFVVGLDDTMRSKPEPDAFAFALRRLGLPAALTVSIGDRMDVDIEPALALGMGGILVGGVEEVRTLPAFFANRA